jgi:phosphopantothenate-cysteine ligase
MKIIITAGGTTEKIDPVRKITNMATGRLGSLTAGEFVRQGGGRIETIFYVCGRDTVVPDLPCVETVPAESAEEVRDALSGLLTSRRIDAVIHSMAVSDYTVDKATTAEDLAAFLAEKLFPLGERGFPDESSLAGFLAGCIRENDRLLDQSRKISSDVESLILSMKRTPKLIRLIKSLQPSAVLVGFKLLNGVEKQRLLDAGYEVLVRNSCDLVLANDKTEIGAGRHVGYLISPDRTFDRFGTKEEIAGAIAGRVLTLIGERERQ